MLQIQLKTPDSAQNQKRTPTNGYAQTVGDGVLDVPLILVQR